jgi:hypothetical protein
MIAAWNHDLKIGSYLSPGFANGLNQKLGSDGSAELPFKRILQVEGARRF